MLFSTGRRISSVFAPDKGLVLKRDSDPECLSLYHKKVIIIFSESKKLHHLIVNIISNSLCLFFLSAMLFSY